VCSGSGNVTKRAELPEQKDTSLHRVTHVSYFSGLFGTPPRSNGYATSVYLFEFVQMEATCAESNLPVEGCPRGSQDPVLQGTVGELSLERNRVSCTRLWERLGSVRCPTANNCSTTRGVMLLPAWLSRYLGACKLPPPFPCLWDSPPRSQNRNGIKYIWCITVVDPVYLHENVR
jgi:hypothetical protein